ncbi:MAG: exodeoxyribonuclease VII small subunit [Anaerovoracaceae bacterium]|jgi:exodeoxyribonuclease VII small subunit|nr:exodeoxyribonuclease VII small subunit [Anaerovoracaceae bacterium]
MTDEKITFEEAYEKLRAAGEKLDSGEVTLEEAIKNYEDGIKYYKICKQILDDAKQKIESFNTDEE